MAEKSIENANKSDFRTSIPELHDDEIINILKKRSQYQSEAANLAIQEAIKRKLINSEQDLFLDEFRDNPNIFSIFPTIENDVNKNKIRKSISRSLLISGAIPIVWGIIVIIKNQLLEGILLTLLGVVWLYASVQILRDFNSRMVTILFMLLIASVVYIMKIMLEMKGLVLMDYFIPVIICSLIAYVLLLLRKMNQ